MTTKTAAPAPNVFRNRDWLILGPIAVAAFVLAFWGFNLCQDEACKSDSALQALRRSVDLLRGRGDFSFGKDPWQLVIAQYLVPVVALFTAAKLVLQSLRRDVRVAFARRSHDHVIVCGLGETGLNAVENLRRDKERVVAVDLDSDSPHAVTCERLGVPVIRGDASHAVILKLAGVERARALLSSTGNDATNLEIAFRATELVEQRGGSRRLAIRAEMRSDWLFDRLANHAGATLGSAKAECVVFNGEENAARLLFRSPHFTRLGRFAHVGAPHLMIVGLGGMGREIIAQAVGTAFALPNERLTITIVDAGGETAASPFLARYPGLGEVADLRFIAARLSSGDPQSWAAVDEALAATALTAVAVCLPDENDSLYAAMRLRERLDMMGAVATPVFFRLARREMLGRFAARLEQWGLFRERFVPYGDTSQLTSPAILFDSKLDRLARACHEHYLELTSGALPSPSREPWERLPELYKRSNRRFADHTEIKLRAAGLRSQPAADAAPMSLNETEVEMLAVAEHTRWLIERQLTGWRYGAARDEARRIHPLIKPWADLDDATREQNREAMRRLPQILSRADLEIRRDKVLRAYGEYKEGAAAALDAHADSPGVEHLVLIVDEADERSGELGVRAADTPHTSFVVRLCGAPGDRAAQAPVSPAPARLTRAEGWLTPDEEALVLEKGAPRCLEKAGFPQD